jgi:hypothetical protein
MVFVVVEEEEEEGDECGGKSVVADEEGEDERPEAFAVMCTFGALLRALASRECEGHSERERVRTGDALCRVPEPTVAGVVEVSGDAGCSSGDVPNDAEGSLCFCSASTLPLTLPPPAAAPPTRILGERLPAPAPTSAALVVCPTDSYSPDYMI